MLYEKDIYGTEGEKRTPQENKEIARETEMDLIREAEKGLMGVRIDKRAQRVEIYEKLTGEVWWETTIADYNARLEEAGILGTSGKESATEH